VLKLFYDLHNVCPTCDCPVDIISKLSLQICFTANSLLFAALSTCSPHLLLLTVVSDILKTQDANKYCVPAIHLRCPSSATLGAKCWYSRHLHCQQYPASQRHETTETNEPI
jgi:hypothetical protein